MKNITKQYQDLLEGKMSKENFMRSVRRDFPQWIAPVNSFQDAVNILKSKRILVEGDLASHGAPSPETQAGARHIAKMWDSLSKEARAEVIKVAGIADTPGLVAMDFDAMMAAMPAGQGSMSKLYKAIKQAAEDESMVSQMQAKQGFDPNFPGKGSILENEITQFDIEQALKNMWEDGIIDTAEWKTASKALDTFDIEGNMNMVGKTTAEDLAKELVYVATGTFVRGGEEAEYDSEQEEDPTFDDRKKNLKEAAEKPEGRYKEATGKAEYDKFAEMDRVNYRQLMKGMEFELLKMPEITDENLIKAKKKAYKTLIKNPKAYLDLLVKNEKEVEKRDKDLRMQAVKKDNLADKANAMKVLKKDEGSNTQTNQSNKEKAKGMPEGVKVMKESFVEQLRNYILSEMIEVGSPKTSHRTGEMVKTPKGEVGTVEEVTPDNTAKVKLENGTMVEYQGNVLEPHQPDNMMQEDEPTMEENVQFPDLRKMWNSMSTEEKINSLKRNKFLDKKTDDIYAELANLSFEDLFYQGTEARKRYKIAPYAALLQGLLFPQSTPTQAVGSEKDDLDKNAALKEKLADAVKEVTRVTYKGANEYVKDSDVAGKIQQIVAAGGSAGDIKRVKL